MARLWLSVPCEALSEELRREWPQKFRVLRVPSPRQSRRKSRVGASAGGWAVGLRLARTPGRSGARGRGLRARGSEAGAGPLARHLNPAAADWDAPSCALLCPPRRLPRAPAGKMRSSLAPGIWLLRTFSRDSWYRGFILLLTFLIYVCFHMSRKPISVVKSRLHQNCSEIIQPPNATHDANDTTWCNWSPFDQNNYKELLGGVDDAFLVAYAIGMFISGIFGERLPLRYYLTAGMLLSGLFTSLLGMAYFWDIHELWYFVVIQICNGLVQTTGWPSVVTCVGNWFGKGKRGFIMGIWNSHTSVGNIVGTLLAGVWVSGPWGLSFVVPGIIIAAMGVFTFLFLIEYPEDVDCTPPQHHGELEENQNNPEDPGSNPYSHQERSLEAAGSSKEPSAQPAAISFWGALMIPGVIEFSLCLLFAKLVSYTFLYWLPLYIFNVAQFSSKEAGDLSTLFDVGGIMGGILAGLISDYTNGRATTCCIMLILAAPLLFLYNHFGQNGITITIVMLVICGALVNGPYSLITTAVSADLGTHKSLKGNSKALSTVTAIIDGTGSIGAALGPLLAGLISPMGWNNVFYMLISADILACLLLCRLVYKEILAWKSALSKDTGSCLALTPTR